MAILYRNVKSVEPGQEIPTERPIAVSKQTITPEEFMKKFASTSRLSEIELVRFSYALKRLIINEIKAGNIIQTGIFGTFSPKVKTKGINLEIGLKYHPDKNDEGDPDSGVEEGEIIIKGYDVFRQA